MLQLNYSGHHPEAGCDEAGRGCLAGPVFAAAVVLPPDFNATGLNDSKQLSEKKRDYWRSVIEKEAISWAVAECSAKEIDDINILNASILAMQRALDKLEVLPHFVIVDGNRFKPWKKAPHQCVIKGDTKFANIAAAAILAKTHRDEHMRTLHLNHPHYKWNTNAGYPTIAHRSAISEIGPCQHHRMTFRLLEEQLSLL